MKSKHVFRVGDRVRITDPRRILSVGYATNIGTMRDKALADERVLSFCQSLHLGPKHTKKVVQAVAGSFLAKSLHSGAKRDITFSDPEPDLLSSVFTVVSKHVCYTGVYSAATGGGAYYEYDYDPACLYNSTAHVILELSGYCYRLSVQLFDPSRKGNKYASGLFVTTEQVKPVTDDK